MKLSWRIRLRIAVNTVVLFGLASPAELKADFLVLNPVSDGYVDSFSSGKNVNFDTATEAILLNGNSRIGLMKFDIPASLKTGFATILSATLTVKVASPSSSFFNLAQPTEDWIADEVTYNNPNLGANGWDGAGGNIATAIGASLNDFGQTMNGATTSWNFLNPSIINSWADGDEVSGLFVHRASGGGTAGYDTLESGSLDTPILVIDFISTAPGGDYNGDGSVDGADFLMWQRGQSPNPLSAFELAGWELNFGTTSGSLLAGSNAVPEPSAFALLAVAIGFVCSAARRNYFLSGRVA